MKKLSYFLLVSILLITSNLLFSQSFVYVSPKDNSILVSLKTNIILKSTGIIDPSSLSQNEFSVSGSLSGEHEGEVKLSDDNKTVLYIPSTPFSANENVVVIVNRGIKTTEGTVLPSVTIHFKTTPLVNAIALNTVLNTEDESDNSNQNAAAIYKTPGKSLAGNTLPSNFPQITVGTSNNPSSGKMFIANQFQNANNAIGNYLMILNNDVSDVKYKSIPQSANLFKMEANGYLSYNLKGNGTRFIMDTSFTMIDTFQCGNGYSTDGHDFVLLPNGHALMFAGDPEPYDMSQVVTGGNPDAIVTGLVVQELDASKNVIFQWRSWDYLPITDSYFDLTQVNVDLIHANALAVDNDGNILVSMRHLSCVAKINRETGDIIWLLGGKENEFTFINEHASNAPTYFSYQHDISILPNGDLTLFDNGNQHTPNYSRGVEYALDEQNKTATLVWEYRHTPDIYANAMGSVERLSDGNTVIGWGIATGAGIPVFTEVHPDNSTALEIFFPSGLFSYRSYNYQWVSQTPEAQVSTSGGILQGNSYIFRSLNDTTGITITFNLLNSALNANAMVTSYNYSPVNPLFSTTAPLIVSNYFNIQGTGINSYTGLVYVKLKYFPAVINPGATIVYARSNTDSNFVPMPTSYDSTDDVISFTTSTLGDFAFGIPQTVDSAYALAPISPADSAIVLETAPVKLTWGTRGIVQTYHLQVSGNASFSNPVVDNSSLTSTNYTISSLNKNAAYYWRVNNTNAAGTSAWSNTEIFSTAPAYIKMLSPNGGENLYPDSTYIIRWQSNLKDTVNINLINGNNIASVIGDSIAGGTNAFQWQVPSNLKPGSSYKIMVTSISNDSLYGLSSSAFNISIVNAVKVSNNIVKNFQLAQNYPNPFNPSTVIQYSIPQESQVRIDVYNVIGQKITTLMNSVQKSGNYEVTWDASALASGVYFYSLKASANTGKNYFAVKKMMLLK
jgi:hypothetical protein